MPDHSVARRVSRSDLQQRRGHTVSPRIPRLEGRHTRLDTLCFVVCRWCAAAAVKGLDHAEVALTLNYSERTVKNVIRGVLDRHQPRNRTHAVAFALRRGAL